MTLGARFSRGAAVGLVGFGLLQLAVPSVPSMLAIEVLVIAACLAAIASTLDWVRGGGLTDRPEVGYD